MRKGTCIYFTGILNEECEKGINYRLTAPGAAFGWATMIPCMAGNSGTCELFKEPTDEELKENQEQAKRSQNGAIKAISLIQQKTKADPDFNEEKGNKKGTNGFIDCPVCNHPLHYTVAPGNNHISGQCSREGCLAWMM